MNTETLKQFLTLLMRSDPRPTCQQNDTGGSLVAFANKEASAHGYEDWVDAYHQL